MRASDLLRLVFGAVWALRLRSVLTALGIAVGIASVILLTSIGKGVERFVIAEFTQFGTNLISVAPGKAQTHGGGVGMIASTKLVTLEDAEALRRVPNVLVADPIVQGNAETEHGGRSRRVTVYGVGPDLPEALQMRVRVGSFLPREDPRSARALVVLGARVVEELFGAENPLGRRIRIGGERYRVIGIMEPKGQIFGFDLDDTVFVPAARALDLFNREGLMEIHVTYVPDAPLAPVVEGIRAALVARHGREDFTITPQRQMLEVLGSVLDVLTFAVGALGGISIVVGAVGILTIMVIAVGERRAEIGLLRSLGAGKGQVLALFLGEAVALAALGGLAGLVLGVGLARILHVAVPALPVETPWTFAVLAEVAAAAIGLAAGAIPARRAASIDPVDALRAE